MQHQVCKLRFLLTTSVGQLWFTQSVQLGDVKGGGEMGSSLAG
jgi:hypothetical protein